jgi:hypothetical protein
VSYFRIALIRSVAEITCIAMAVNETAMADITSGWFASDALADR